MSHVSASNAIGIIGTKHTDRCQKTRFDMETSIPRPPCPSCTVTTRAPGTKHTRFGYVVMRKPQSHGVSPLTCFGVSAPVNPPPPIHRTCPNQGYDRGAALSRIARAWLPSFIAIFSFFFVILGSAIGTAVSTELLCSTLHAPTKCVQVRLL